MLPALTLIATLIIATGVIAYRNTRARKVETPTTHPLDYVPDEFSDLHSTVEAAGLQ